ncbi:RNA polymerase sigma factor [Dictyobacter formicarum]|uniref:RNA polymerase subunit sigma-24 n=1 Tax=Dictyobacter formicarum TaxID=2778368 RepID=A0ABQ3VQQ2_9CHLR|nr:sigma-70 family RNA polymerase sigma factor [Dictyobacter formicarum]GHO87723.1 RNA polymerase subunit sigma-24 [Dictyobacter formicarum]
MDTIPAAQAVETLIHEYYKLVFHTIYGLTNNWEESQDLTQDTFHQALKGIDAARASSGGHFHAKAWLLRIALNTVRMQRRRRALFSFIPFSSMHEKRQQQEGNERNASGDEMVQAQAARVQPGGYGAVGNEDPAEFVAEQDAVQRTMALLPEPLRICLLFSIVGGLSTAEIADMLDLKEAAVRQRLVRARKQFQQLYSQQSGEELADAAPPLSTNSQVQQSDGQDRKQRNAHKDTHRRLSLANQAPSIGSGYA